MDLLERMVALWTEPLPADDEAAVALARELYADPVTINGVLFELRALVGRGRAQQRALAEQRLEIIDRIELPGKLVIVFRELARHVGPLPTVLGELPATGKMIERQSMEVATLQDGRIVDVRFLSDDLGMLSRLDAIKLKA